MSQDDGRKEDLGEAERRRTETLVLARAREDLKEKGDPKTVQGFAAAGTTPERVLPLKDPLLAKFLPEARFMKVESAGRMLFAIYAVRPQKPEIVAIYHAAGFSRDGIGRKTAEGLSLLQGLKARDADDAVQIVKLIEYFQSWRWFTSPDARIGDSFGQDWNRCVENFVRLEKDGSIEVVYRGIEIPPRPIPMVRPGDPMPPLPPPIYKAVYRRYRFGRDGSMEQKIETEPGKSFKTIQEVEDDLKRLEDQGR
jgi:hypothetical protein